MNAVEYLVTKFEQYDVILLGEIHAVKENLDFLADAIPYLYEAGVYYLGMEFGASEDQELLDQLITAEEFDEKLAYRLMFNYNVAWPYVEYVNLYKSAWKLNRTLQSTDKKFRVLNLSYQFDWSKFQGFRTPAACQKVFYKGNIEKYRADLIEREIIEKNEKILVITGTVHAFTHYHYPKFSANEENFVEYETKLMGNRLYEKFPHQTATILLHQSFMDKENLNKTVSPANGFIENQFDYPSGFDLLDLRDDSYYSTGYENFKMSDLANGYIYLKPLNQLTKCTINYQFLDGIDFNLVMKNYPDSDWKKPPKNIKEYFEIIESR